MARKRKYRYFVADFETTVYKGQETTEVWAAALVEMGSEKVLLFHSIDEIFYYLKRKIRENVIVYFHNLKFDGSFWLDFLINKVKMRQASVIVGDDSEEIIPHYVWDKPWEMENNTFQYSISNRGQWYKILIRTGYHFIEIRDSLKLLPFAVKKIGKDFKTKHQKLDMEYVGFRYAGCTISPEEQEYIKNDVLVVKEALEIMYAEGHTKLTIGSCCLEEFKRTIPKKLYEGLFPTLTELSFDTPDNGMVTADNFIRHSYKGGWCYVVPEKRNKVFEYGITADVNSLYPSVMHSDSGNYYPVGLPTYWVGNYIPENVRAFNRYFFIRIRCRFYLKKGFLPFIQIKGNPLYRGTENLETSDYVNPKTGTRSRFYRGRDGEWHDTRVELTLTMTDYILFKEHYNIAELEIVDGCYFETRIGIFDEYINKYAEIKQREKGAKRQIAKLFLNNLYGKMASNTDSSFKYAYANEESGLSFIEVLANDKAAGYIPIGSAITSYARNFTIRAAQKNYYGPDQRGFIYADTDSIHCDLKPEELKGVPVHDTAFNHWKLESSWDKAIFVRQKTYIEHNTHENLIPLDKPFYNIKCAGMPDRCKEVFNRSLERKLAWDDEDMCDMNRNLINRKCTLEDFKIGLKIYGKLIPKRIPGGVILQETTYEMR